MVVNSLSSQLQLYKNGYQLRLDYGGVLQQVAIMAGLLFKEIYLEQLM